MVLVLALILALLGNPCPAEDSNMCYWDASTRGNGQGHSFVTLWDNTVLIS